MKADEDDGVEAWQLVRMAPEIRHNKERSINKAINKVPFLLLVACAWHFSPCLSADTHARCDKSRNCWNSFLLMSNSIWCKQREAVPEMSRFKKANLLLGFLFCWWVLFWAQVATSSPIIWRKENINPSIGLGFVSTVESSWINISPSAFCLWLLTTPVSCHVPRIERKKKRIVEERLLSLIEYRVSQSTKDRHWFELEVARTCSQKLSTRKEMAFLSNNPGMKNAVGETSLSTVKVGPNC